MLVPIWTLKTASCSRPICNERVVVIMSDPVMLNDPITVNTNRFVMDGNHRVEARRRLGLLYVDCVWGMPPDDFIKRRMT